MRLTSTGDYGYRNTARLVRSLALASTLAAGLSFAIATPSQATYPDNNLAASPPGSHLPKSLEGSTVYWSQFVNPPFDFDTSRIVAADPHGGHFRVLTHPKPGVHDTDPKVSPDGTRVLFARELPKEFGERIGLVDADGGPVRILKHRCRPPCMFSGGAPRWAPDGRHIVFDKGFGPIVNDNFSAVILYKSDLWGRHLVRLSPPGVEGVFEDSRVTFAPRGYIVFHRLRYADNKGAAFRMNSDGTHVRRLTPWSLEVGEPSVSPVRIGPTRDLVVFETYTDGAPDGLVPAIATVSARSDCRDGCGRIDYLTSPESALTHFNPAWSPDGRQIAYFEFSYVETDTPPVRGDIWRMRWNGKGKAPVSRSPILFDFRPAWGW